MGKGHFHIAVAISVGVLFLTVTIAHACIGMVAAHPAHEHGRMHTTEPMSKSHADAQDEICKSLRDRLVSLAPQPPQAHSFITALNTITAIAEPPGVEIQAFTAERPPGVHPSYNQSALYILKSVFRI